GPFPSRIRTRFRYRTRGEPPTRIGGSASRGVAMSEQRRDEDDLAVAEWVDEVADCFEAAWRGLSPPSLADFLGTATGPCRAALLAELEKIDRAYRLKLGAAGVVAETPNGSGRPTHHQAVTPHGEGSVEQALARGEGWPEVPGYEILGELGRGGMGVVYKARQTKLQRLVALKMVPGGAGGGRRQRLLTEARAAARLQHPNIVQIYEVGERDGQPFFALE